MYFSSRWIVRADLQNWDTRVLTEVESGFGTLKVTIHLERCFQFSVCNSVNTHRIPPHLYINGKLMKLYK